MQAGGRSQLQLPEALGLDDAKLQTSCRCRPGAALPSHETQWPMDRPRTVTAKYRSGKEERPGTRCRIVIQIQPHSRLLVLWTPTWRTLGLDFVGIIFDPALPFCVLRISGQTCYGVVCVYPRFLSRSPALDFARPALNPTYNTRTSLVKAQSGLSVLAGFGRESHGLGVQLRVTRLPTRRQVIGHAGADGEQSSSG